MSIVTHDRPRVTTARRGAPKRRSLEALAARLDLLSIGADPERQGRVRILRRDCDNLARQSGMSYTGPWMSAYDNLELAIRREEVR